MNYVLIAGLVLLTPLAAGAEDSDEMKALKATGICVACALGGSDLRWANVYEAELAGAPNLVGADLSKADLRGANLFGANLESTKLVGANLNGADLRWASLLAADLSGADMTDAQLEGAIFCKTVMPDGTQNNSHC